TLLLNRIDPNLFVARGFVNLLALPMVLISASRAKSWNIDVKVSRQMAFHTASLMATGLYLSAMALTGYLLQQIEGAWSNVLQIVFLAGAFLILVIVIASGSARANIRVWIAKNFFTYRFDYREVWLRVTDAISTPGPLGLHERIVRAIAELVECTAGALWVHVPEDKAFLPTARWHFGDPETEPLSALGAQDAFVRYLAESGWVVDLRETKPATSDTEVVAPPDWLATHRKARFVVPFFHGDALRAILVIGAPRIRDTMDWEERDLLKTAGRQAASYLAEEAAADALSDARRLEDFHKRSAFIVHDIKNSIGQLELLIANAERYKDRPEFQEDMLLTVDNTVSQMKKLLQTFKQDRAEAAAGTPEPAPCAKDSVAQAVIPNAEPVAAVVRRSVRNWLPKKNDLEIEIDPHPDMEVDGEKMESVLNHLIHNAVEATAAGGTVALRLAEENGRILLEVRDTGPGMDKDFIEKKLFKPLDSGHENGFGLGAYQTREMVRDMGGRLEVDSAPGRGTIMRITLSPAIMPGSSNPTPKANQ
ncbi:MAG: XrtA/PEP-CTERM system histidine kinase PrsK, partial [Magnetospiraceae bacterium]